MVKRSSKRRKKRSSMGGKLLILKRSFSRINNKPVKCKRTVKRRGKNVMIINEKCSSKRSKRRGSKRKKRKCKNCGKMYRGGGNHMGSCTGGGNHMGSCTGGGHHHIGGCGSRGGGYGLKGGG